MVDLNSDGVKVGEGRMELNKISCSEMKIKFWIEEKEMIAWRRKIRSYEPVIDDVSIRVVISILCGYLGQYLKDDKFRLRQVARGGKSITLVGSKLMVFGGEDRHRGLLIHKWLNPNHESPHSPLLIHDLNSDGVHVWVITCLLLVKIPLLFEQGVDVVTQTACNLV